MWKHGRDWRTLRDLKIAIREEVAKVTWAQVCDGHRFDLQLVAIDILDGSEFFFEWRMEDVSLRKFLELERWGAVWMILEVKEDAS